MIDKVRWGVLGTARIATATVIPAMQRGQWSMVVTYHDSTRGNAGGLYRPTDVDIVTEADGVTGYALGYV